MTNRPIIWIIDRQQWPRSFLRAEMIERGYEAIGYEELFQALLMFRIPDLERPHIIVLELCGLRLKGDELQALTEKGIPIIILGSKKELEEEIIREFDWVATVQRPCTIGTVADKIEKIIKQIQKDKK